MHEIYLIVDVLAARDTDRGDTDERSEKSEEVNFLDFHVRPHDDCHLQDDLEAGLKEGLQNLELHGPGGHNNHEVITRRLPHYKAKM